VEAAERIAEADGTWRPAELPSISIDVLSQADAGLPQARMAQYARPGFYGSGGRRRAIRRTKALDSLARPRVVLEIIGCLQRPQRSVSLPPALCQGFPDSRRSRLFFLAFRPTLLYMRAHSTGGFSLFLIQGMAPVAGFSSPNRSAEALTG
jgi:hypothetical protein